MSIQQQNQQQKDLDVDPDFMEYTDSSEAIYNFYKNQSSQGMEKYIIFIENWLQKDIDPDDNKPLIIEGQDTNFIKSLFVHWKSYHQQRENKAINDIILSHFFIEGQVESQFNFVIYRFLINLREQLKINQKVDLIEEKSRTFFNYWLDVSSRKIEEEGDKNSKIILLVDQIESYCDSYGKIAHAAFWLPKIFPKNVRVILSCSNQSSLDYFQNLNCANLNVYQNSEQIMAIADRYIERDHIILNSELKQKHISVLKDLQPLFTSDTFFILFYSGIFLPKPLDSNIYSSQDYELLNPQFSQIFQGFGYEDIQECESVDETVEMILNFLQQKIIDPKKFSNLLGILSFTNKGLTENEILQYIQITKEELVIVTTLFKPFIIVYKNLWKIYGDRLKRLIQKQFFNDINSQQKLYEDIAITVEKSQNSVRKLEEVLYQIHKSNQHFKLKETISTIENFLLLYNPYNTFDLCRYWQVMEENGFDPVTEYNKAIEEFEMHSHPNNEQMFRIILQISRFLQEFGDFEIFLTPEFRHPPIRGGQDLKEIGILEELQKLKLHTEIDSKRKLEILSEIENLSTDNPNSREIVRKYYLEEGMKGLSEKDLRTAQQELSRDLMPEFPKNNKFKNPQSYIIQLLKFVKDRLNQIQERIHGTPSFNTFLQDNRDKKSQTPTYYYYKRWIWVQFPWACQSLKMNYSEIINMCYASPTEYMTVEEEHEFRRQALKIAYEAKDKKKSKIQFMDRKKQSIENITNPSTASGSDRNPGSNQKFEVKKIMMPQQQQQQQQQQQNSTSNFNLTNKSLNSTKFQQNQKLSRSLSPKGSRLIEGINISQQQTQQNLTQMNYSQMNQSLQSNSNNKQKQSKQMYLTDEIFKLKRGLEFNSEYDTLPQIEKTTQFNNYQTSKFGRSKQAMEKINSIDQISKIKTTKNDSDMVLLPKIKETLNEYTEKEMNMIGKQNNIMKKDLDHIVYTNKTMARELKEFKIINYNTSLLVGELNEMDKLNKKIQEMQNKINNIQNKVKVSESSQSRLTKIINVCERNKTQNTEWVNNLGNLSVNMTKLIEHEEKRIKEKQIQIKNQIKLCDQFIDNCYDRTINHKDIIINIKNNINHKKKINQLVSQEYVPNNSSQDQVMERVQNDKTSKEFNNITSTHPDTNSHQQDKVDKNYLKRLNEKLKSLKQQVAECEQALGQPLDSDYKSSEKFKNYLDSMEKQRELAQSILENQFQYDQLKKEYSRKKKYIRMLNKAIIENENENSDLENNNTNNNSQQQTTTGEKTPNNNNNSNNNNINSSFVKNERLKEYQNLQEKPIYQIQKKKERKIEELDHTIKEHRKLKQILLSAFQSIQTMCNKLNISKKETQNFDESIPPTLIKDYLSQITENLVKRQENLKSQMKENDYEQFNKGKLFLKSYKVKKDSKNQVEIQQMSEVNMTQLRKKQGFPKTIKLEPRQQNHFNSKQKQSFSFKSSQNNINNNNMDESKSNSDYVDEQQLNSRKNSYSMQGQIQNSRKSSDNSQKLE